MTVAEAMRGLNVFFETLRNAPPASVMVNGLASLGQEACLKEILARGPTANYYAIMREAGWEQSDAERLWHNVIRDAMRSPQPIPQPTLSGKV